MNHRIREGVEELVTKLYNILFLFLTMKMVTVQHNNNSNGFNYEYLHGYHVKCIISV